MLFRSSQHGSHPNASWDTGRAWQQGRRGKAQEIRKTCVVAECRRVRVLRCMIAPRGHHGHRPRRGAGGVRGLVWAVAVRACGLGVDGGARQSARRQLLHRGSRPNHPAQLASVGSLGDGDPMVQCRIKNAECRVQNAGEAVLEARESAHMACPGPSPTPSTDTAQHTEGRRTPGKVCKTSGKKGGKKSGKRVGSKMGRKWGNGKRSGNEAASFPARTKASVPRSPNIFQFWQYPPAIDPQHGTAQHGTVQHGTVQHGNIQ